MLHIEAFSLPYRLPETFPGLLATFRPENTDKDVLIAAPDPCMLFYLAHNRYRARLYLHRNTLPADSRQLIRYTILQHRPVQPCPNQDTKFFYNLAATPEEPV